MNHTNADTRIISNVWGDKFYIRPLAEVTQEGMPQLLTMLNSKVRNRLAFLAWCYNIQTIVGNPNLAWVEFASEFGSVAQENVDQAVPKELEHAANEVSADKEQFGGDHYKNLAIEPWAAMESWLTTEEFLGFLRGNIIKYHARAHANKEPAEMCIAKAGHYQRKLEETLKRIDTQISKK